MPNRREFLVTAAGVAAAGATASLSLSVQAREQDNPADNATAITEVYGDGMRLMGVSVEYRRPVNAAQIKAADYRVEGRTIREVYVSRTPAGTPYRSGRYVVIELNPDEAGALLVVKHPPAGKDASAAAGQNADEASGNAAVTGAGSASGAASGNAAGAGAGSASGAASGNAAGTGAGNASGTASGNTAAADAGKGPGNAGEKQEAAPTLEPARATVIVEPSNGQGSAQTLTTSRTVNRVFDDFQHFEYRDEATGKTVRYNLFAPRNRRAGQRYPLVLFMHDAGVTGSNVEATLYQGDGAIAWARPEAQSRNPCFVLAPQFDEIIADDDNRTSGYLDATINLVRQLTSDLPIDENRIYTTGQSGGGMMSIAMNIKYPDFFAASYLVACQWNADLITQNMAGVNGGSLSRRMMPRRTPARRPSWKNWPNTAPGWPGANGMPSGRPPNFWPLSGAWMQEGPTSISCPSPKARCSKRKRRPMQAAPRGTRPPGNTRTTSPRCANGYSASAGGDGFLRCFWGPIMCTGLPVE